MPGSGSFDRLTSVRNLTLPGLLIRRAAGVDFRAIRRIAAHSFPLPVGWLAYPSNIRHYNPRWAARARSLGLSVRVAVHQRLIVGYLYSQARPDGDLYIKEIAATPPDPATKVAGVGTLLLHHALDWTLRRGHSTRVTLNILAEHRVIRDQPGFTGVRDPFDFYARFGLAESHEPGYAFNGGPRAEGDTWMVGAVAEVHRRTAEYLASRILV